MTDFALYTLWLILAGQPGRARTYKLIQQTDPKSAYHATRAELIPWVGTADAEYFLNKDLRPARRLLEECKEKGIDIVCYHDKAYPPTLREISDPPPALFYLGTFPKPDRPILGIVGTRQCSPNAKTMAAEFSCSLALSGFQIVSGMANGIDTYVHKGSLIKGKASFAVLGCGVDKIYPKENETLYNLLKEQGGLISEYLPGTPPLAANFPRRNRIISGLSDGVLVVECPQKSGSMITARFAVEQNRTLFAIPSSPKDRVNTGTNRLIKHGAIFCTEPEDIINEFQSRYGDLLTKTVVRFVPAEEPVEPAPKKVPVPKQEPPKEPKTPPKAPSPPGRSAPPPLSPEETVVYKALDSDVPISADDLTQRTGLPFYRLLPLLQALELSGCAESLPGSMFRRK